MDVDDLSRRLRSYSHGKQLPGLWSLVETYHSSLDSISSPAYVPSSLIKGFYRFSQKLLLSSVTDGKYSTKLIQIFQLWFDNVKDCKKLCFISERCGQLVFSFFLKLPSGSDGNLQALNIFLKFILYIETNSGAIDLAMKVLLSNIPTFSAHFMSIGDIILQRQLLLFMLRLVRRATEYRSTPSAVAQRFCSCLVPNNVSFLAMASQLEKIAFTDTSSNKESCNWLEGMNAQCSISSIHTFKSGDSKGSTIVHLGKGHLLVESNDRTNQLRIMDNEMDRVVSTSNEFKICLYSHTHPRGIQLVLSEEEFVLARGKFQARYRVCEQPNRTPSPPIDVLRRRVSIDRPKPGMHLTFWADTWQQYEATETDTEIVALDAIPSTGLQCDLRQLLVSVEAFSEGVQSALQQCVVTVHEHSQRTRSIVLDVLKLVESDE